MLCSVFCNATKGVERKAVRQTAEQCGPYTLSTAAAMWRPSPFVVVARSGPPPARSVDRPVASSRNAGARRRAPLIRTANAIMVRAGNGMEVSCGFGNDVRCSSQKPTSPWVTSHLAFVKGFGCRPRRRVRQALAAGVRKPPREETAGMGTCGPAAMRYGDLSAADEVAAR